MRGAEPGLGTLGYMRATDPQVWGIQRFVSSYTECLLLLSTPTHVSQARRLPATRRETPRIAQPHSNVMGRVWGTSTPGVRRLMT